jgi:hypothetical protein
MTSSSGVQARLTRTSRVIDAGDNRELALLEGVAQPLHDLRISGRAGLDDHGDDDIQIP